MNKFIKDSLLNGKLILFIGAGASATSKTKDGAFIPMSGALAELLCQKAGMNYGNEGLSMVYNAVKKTLGESQLQDILESKFKFCRYSEEYELLTALPLKRIYTLNIDDCLENAFRHQKRNIDVKNRNDRIVEYDYEKSITTLVKLNGDINTPSLGYIFSPQEYAQNTLSNNNWYEELAQDMHNYTFVFIGTKLNEPLLEYHLQKFKNDNGVTTSTKGYVITPSASDIEKTALLNTNLEHVCGTLKDFVEYFYKEFDDNIPTHSDILKNIKPYIIDNNGKLDVVSKIEPITLDKISKIERKQRKVVKVENFYKGFKPTWEDVVYDIPVLLRKTLNFIERNNNNFNNAKKLFAILGNAGSGKSTALKQIALQVMKNSNTPVYFVHNDYDNLFDIVKYLDSINNSSYIIFIDRILNNKYYEISEILSSGEKVSFVITENTVLWEGKAKSILNDFLQDCVDMSHIEKEDVNIILSHLQKYGSWTRLAKMDETQRYNELWVRAKKQLLIGLLEATSGIGYDEIIQKDFESFSETNERNLLLLASIPALENLTANEKTLIKAMSYLNKSFSGSIKSVADNLQGVLLYNDGLVSTRHRVYSSKIFKQIDDKEKYKILESYIMAFCYYQFPIVVNISKKEAEIYKHLSNFKFLHRFFNQNKGIILRLYKFFEKYLEQDGLFLAQYGLALRKFNKHLEAYEKLRLAKIAYPESPHIEHSLAQQMLILASVNWSHKFNREELFENAKEILLRISNLSIGDFKSDRYPIVALSKGHINFLVYKKDFSEAKRIAAKYFNDIQKLPDYNTNQYLKGLAESLIYFSTQGKWKNTKS